MFGGQLLVAPITKPANKQINLGAVKVWLPEGTWTDIFTDRVYRGGGFVTMHRDLDTIPVLAGEGAIVPMYRQDRANALDNSQPLEIHIWRGNGNFELYEDDGESSPSNHLITRLQLEEAAQSLRFTIRGGEGDLSLVPEKRQIRLVFRDIVSADATVDGRSVPYSREGIDLTVDTAAGAVICLEHVSALRNIPREQLVVELKTRVQGEIIWKNAVLNSRRKMPGNVREALEELDALI
jgi:hypothetical protein